MSLYLGLLSGTSADAVDVALVDFSNSKPQIVSASSYEYPQDLREKILDLYNPSDNEIDRLGELDNQLGEMFAECALQTLKDCGVVKEAVSAIGSHGQTIRHRPHLSANRFTLQIGNPNVISENTGITTIADFRRRDIAAGGQGAPLAPALHSALFHSDSVNRAVLNIGGISNLTYLPTSGQVIGFDCGPGNGLMDAWTHKHHGLKYDANGAWAARGTIDKPLLDRLMTAPYFQAAPPKSTGREDFSLSWLEKNLQHHPSTPAENVQATLLELTCRSIAQSVHKYCANTEQVFVCGGGVHNQQLMSRIRALLSPADVETTEVLGLHPDWVEAVLFAWLAKQTIEGLPGNLPSVTGAKYPRVLGAIYPA